MDSPSGSSSLLDFLCLIGKLKHLKRTGWVHCGVQEPECVASHMYRMGIMAILFADSSLDRERMVKLALVHDMGEAIVGDITPHCGVSNEEKYRREHEAMQKIQSILSGLPAADEFLALWLEVILLLASHHSPIHSR
jgi:putative hydrolase of HD superfamily